MAASVKDNAFAAAVGKFIPQLPKLRANAVATYRPDDDWSLHPGRALQRPQLRHHRQFRSHLPDLSGLCRLFRGRMRASATSWTRTGTCPLGVDNLNNDKYFLFHPFPQRTFVMEVHYRPIRSA